MHFKADRRSSRLRFKTLLCGRPHWGARRKVLKKVFIVLIVFSLFFVTEVTAEEKTKEYFYVNSVDGLRIRKDSNVESEKIGSLKNKERVEVISCSLIPVEIDGITSSWYEIKTEEGIQGFAFGGYLESDLENVEIIQAVEGDYWDEKKSDNVQIKNIGNGKLLITTNIPLYSFNQQEIGVKVIYDIDLFSFIGERGGLSDQWTLRFNEDKQLILQHDRYEIVYYDGDDTGKYVETHKKSLFTKK